MAQTPSGNHTIAVIGAGSWGTALAIAFARAGSGVRLWARDAAQATAMAQTRRNEAYLPGFELPTAITVVRDLAAALQGDGDILVAVPSHAFRETLLLIRDCSPAARGLAWATKGFELDSGALPHTVVGEVFGDRLPAAVLSGPTFAKEVAEGLPSALTGDVAGVEIGGATKNVFAIGAGLCDGLGFGANTRVALITRGLAEMTRLGIELGARRETFMGLAGIGDLVLTCTDDLSRNRRFGLALARGSDAREAMREIGQVVEGYYAARAVREVAKQHDVDMPIVAQIYRVLYEQLSPRDAALELMRRPVSDEL